MVNKVPLVGFRGWWSPQSPPLDPTLGPRQWTASTVEIFAV